MFDKEKNTYNRRPGKSTSQKEIHEKQLEMLAVVIGGVQKTYWCSDKPIDVSDVEDLAIILAIYTRNQRVTANEFDRNSSVAQVGGHGEVGD